MAELKTFVFTDIAGSVRLKDEMVGRSATERDRAFISSILSPHRQRIEQHLAEFDGRVVSTAGDGHFLVFEQTVQAAQWAISVQASHRDQPIGTPSGGQVEVRMSMHVGVPQVDPNDPDNFVGRTVDYTARLNDYATGGQILISRSVMAILDDVSLEGVRLHSHGRRMLKGIGNVEVHELLYDDQGPRQMRDQPKSMERQWTVVPTQGVVTSGDRTSVSLAGTALKRVGNYELEELLGSGGMGDVYKAHHVQFGRIRAVKVIKPQFVATGHEDVIKRFYNEIKAVGRLEHKNIVVAIDSSSPSDAVHYLVMEFIEGVSLDELVAKHGPLPVAEACEIIRQAARGLQYIHKHGMVHRDIKPSNLMVALVEGDQLTSDSTLTQSTEGPRAVVKILDLGLALLAADSQERLTRLDQKAMGTGMYMSPEQWRTTSVDIRADIYSLGCTLYNLLAGNPPFYDSDLRPEKAHEKAPAPPIQSGVEPIPKPLWDVLRKMLEKRPEDRFATPAEVSAALAPFSEGNKLAELVLSSVGGETVPTALLPTKPDGRSKTETWRTRPWFGGHAMRPSRRWLVGIALPLTLMAAFIGGAAWLLFSSRQQARERLEQQERIALDSFAKSAAQRDLPQELKGCFDALSEEAADPKLVELVNSLNNKANDPQLLKDLKDWIIRVPDKHGRDLKVDSWFVQDIRGVQVARSPEDLGSYLHEFWYRDYFHGHGQDLDKKDASLKSQTKPLPHKHLSAVYQSSTSGLLKVAFSVPIWRESAAVEGEKTTRESIGVLAMSMNVNDFTVLDKDLAGGNEVVLIDLRDDWVEGEAKRGLILHHPRLEKDEPTRIDPELLKGIDEADPLNRPNFDGKNFFQTGYKDPLAVNPGQRFYGAFEPVRYKIHDRDEEGANDRFGWIVLVQKPEED
jgi:serine/threonine protein kinase/class 3 adenylate cyclase